MTSSKLPPSGSLTTSLACSPHELTLSFPKTQFDPPNPPLLPPALLHGHFKPASAPALRAAQEVEPEQLR
eukprot:CAMPEP_0168343138 /NCGR_PEP_ID=MMETSP0213-20121227/15869_1 /TAXON_ID=151035 /ORGANISM="Euplotes harpa, Strain FSP1.4" /LENGTH=69 /DNA_ID=CAMNT_0008350285 /DNA_START=83 /DNA_END=287 /DNA_ORIENTATION=+